MFLESGDPKPYQTEKRRREEKGVQVQRREEKDNRGVVLIVMRYGPTYATGDTVGCGITLNNELYFTKNGKNLGMFSMYSCASFSFLLSLFLHLLLLIASLPFSSCVCPLPQ